MNVASSLDASRQASTAASPVAELGRLARLDALLAELTLDALLTELALDALLSLDVLLSLLAVAALKVVTAGTA